MEQIIARQNAAAKPATGKTFLLGVASIVLELALAQVIVNWLIGATGLGLLNILFYAFAVYLLVRFMTRTVAGCIYTLKSGTLTLQKLLGDSTISLVEIPWSSVLSIRPYAFGQRLHLDYRQVTYIDSACAPGLRMRAAFAASLVFAWLARAIAGTKARREGGYIVVYLEDGRRRACAFRPDAAFLAALEEAFPEAYGRDERLEREQLQSYWAQSLRRAFGDLYPHVPDAVTPEELAFEREEFARRREEKIAKQAKRKKIPLEQYKAQLAKQERKKASNRRKRRAFFEAMAEKFAFLSPIKSMFAKLAERLSEEDSQEEAAAGSGESPRRRRGRQE